MDLPSEHLQAATNTDQFAAIAQMAAKRLFPAHFTQPLQIVAHGLGARQDDQVGRRHRIVRPDKGKIDLRMKAQRVKIIMVGNARIGRGDDFQPRPGLRLLVPWHRIFRIEIQAMQIGQHPEYRLAGARLQPGEAGFQQLDVAAKAVDDKALDPRLLAGRKQFQRPHQMREHAAPINVGDEDDRTINCLGKAHVGDVAGAQIDFRRAAGTFDDDRVKTLTQAPPGFEHRLHRARLVLMVITGRQFAHRLTVDDDLRALVAGRLQENRIEVDFRRNAGGQSL